jgi:carbon storage regulator CsrA
MELWPCGHVEPRALPVPRKSNGFLFSFGLCQPFRSYDNYSVCTDLRFHFGWHPTKGGAMLVLTRKVGEKVVIAGHIQVMVVAITGNKVRLGIEAPPGVVVDREEVHRRRPGADGPPPARATGTT